MNILIKYDFPNSSAKTVEAILDDYGITKHYQGFVRILMALAPGSDPINFQGSAINLNTPRVQVSVATTDLANQTTLTPNGGSAWSVLLCLSEA
jgi:hypothetical protein